MSDIKLFNRWDLGEVVVVDPGLKDYINLNPVIVPKTGGRNTKVQFWKSRYNVVERLINKLMIPGHRGKKHKITSGHCTGKGINAYQIVEKCFELIEKKTNKNPVAVFVKAIENSSPREEITTIEYGGARYPQAVDTSPQRRVDFSLRMMVQGAYTKSFDSKRKIFETLADEILKAYEKDITSNAVAKRIEMERQADSSR